MALHALLECENDVTRAQAFVESDIEQLREEADLIEKLKTPPSPPRIPPPPRRDQDDDDAPPPPDYDAVGAPHPTREPSDEYELAVEYDEHEANDSADDLPAAAEKV